MGNKQARTETKDNVSFKSEKETLTRLKILMPALTKMIEPDYGLLEELISMEVLSFDESQTIECSSNLIEKNTKLLQLLFKKKNQEHKELFLESLNKTKQEHVFKWIEQNGVANSDVDDTCWPLSDKQLGILQKNHSKLVEHLDTDDELLDLLLSADCLTYRQIEHLRCVKELSDRNKELLDLLNRRSVDHFQHFTECLAKTQYHLVPLFTGRTVSTADCIDMRPLTNEELAVIRRNSLQLVELIDPENGLLHELEFRRCLSRQQRWHIEAAGESTTRNRQLLTILTRKSYNRFKRFLDCLSTFDQSHIVGLFTGQAVSLQVEATLSGLAQMEMKIINAYRSLKNRNLPQEEIEKLRDKIDHELQQIDQSYQKFALSEGSIKCFFICQSVEQLKALREYYNSGVMKDVLERVFSLLAGESITLSDLKWTFSEYEDHVSQLDLGAVPRSTANENEMTTFDTDQLIAVPLEIKEMILMKAFVQLNGVLRVRLLPSADILTFTSLCSVSWEWWMIIINRKSVRRQLRSAIWRKS